jgi:hypothetical protein
MRFLRTSIHGWLDYGLGVILLAFPLMSGLHQNGIVTWVPILLGLSVVLYSLCTNYEMGLLRILPMTLHLALDFSGGVVLVAVALLFAPTQAAWVLLLVLGVFEIGTSLVTSTVTSDGPGMESPDIMTSTRRSKVAMPLAHGLTTSDGRPDYPDHLGEPKTNEQLRRAIDSGKTGDKIAMTDPAMAPLGSDDEAGDLHDEKGLETARRASRR